MPALGAAPIDLVVERAVRPELVHAQKRDLGMVWVTRHLRGMRDHDPEATAVAQEVFDLELLIGHDEDVPVEPGAIEHAEGLVIEGLHVDPSNLDADLCSQPSDFWSVLRLHGPPRVIWSGRSLASERSVA